MNKYIFISLLFLIELSFSQDNIDGRISLSSFANYTEGLSNRNSLRLKPRLSFNATNLASSKFSLTGYINADYRQYLEDDNYLNLKYFRV